MTKFNADQGLFVAWGAFKGSVQKELVSQFFQLRLWTQGAARTAVRAVRASG